jgi:hypothetical protein
VRTQLLILESSYIAFDFHAFCRNGQFENVALLMDKCSDRLAAIGYSDNTSQPQHNNKYHRISAISLRRHLLLPLCIVASSSSPTAKSSEYRMEAFAPIAWIVWTVPILCKALLRCAAYWFSCNRLVSWSLMSRAYSIWPSRMV